MWCVNCDHEFVNCTCPDKEERARKLVKSGFLITKVCLVCLKHYATCKCEDPVWTTTENPIFQAKLLTQEMMQEQSKNILRLVDSRGAEKEFHDAHVGTYVWLPGSLRQKIANILQVPVYSVAREVYGDIEHRTQGKRVFVQTGEKDGEYVLTFEVIPEDLCQKIRMILDSPITPVLHEESEADYRRNAELLDNHKDIPTMRPE